MMKPMTPFQEALLTATEAQFADVPEEGEIEIHPSQAFYDHIPGKRRALKPFRKAILIAAALALLVGATFATQFFSLGKVEVEKHIFPVEARDNACDVFDIVFYDEIANENAPRSIQTYYLPTKDVTVENVGIVEVSEDGNVYIPLQYYGEHDYSQYDWYLEHIPENPTGFTADWIIGDRQIMFTQDLAYDIPVGEKFSSIAYPPDNHAVMQAEILEINNYEVLSVEVESDLPFEEGRETVYFWYWTNGDYVFRLLASHADKEYMRQLMESVQPMEDMSPYFGEE